MRTMSALNRGRLIQIGILAVLLAVIGGSVLNCATLLQVGADARNNHFKGLLTATTQLASNQGCRLFELVPDKKQTFRLVDKDLHELKIGVHTIESNPAPTKLRLQGTLTFDPNRFVRVHSRFPGEVRRVGPAGEKKRPLQFGDKVAVGDLLATIWCKDIGEKKSELVDALSRVYFDRIVLDRLNSATKLSNTGHPKSSV